MARWIIFGIFVSHTSVNGPLSCANTCICIKVYSLCVLCANLIQYNTFHYIFLELAPTGRLRHAGSSTKVLLSLGPCDVILWWLPQSHVVIVWVTVPSWAHGRQCGPCGPSGGPLWPMLPPSWRTYVGSCSPLRPSKMTDFDGYLAPIIQAILGPRQPMMLCWPHHGSKSTTSRPRWCRFHRRCFLVTKAAPPVEGEVPGNHCSSLSYLSETYVGHIGPILVSTSAVARSPCCNWM